MDSPIRIIGHNLDLTDSLKDYVNKRFQKLQTHFSNIVDIHVALSLERIDHKMQHKAKAQILLPKKHSIVAEETSEDMYASIDLLMAKLDRQIKDFKQQIKDE
jgi:putative sigma-54 modulation protein